MRNLRILIGPAPARGLYGVVPRKICSDAEGLAAGPAYVLCVRYKRTCLGNRFDVERGEACDLGEVPVQIGDFRQEVGGGVQGECVRGESSCGKKGLGYV